MSLTANQRIVSKTKYSKAQDFNWQLEQVAHLIEPLCDKSNLSDENGYPSYHWEIDPDDMKNIIEKLKERDGEEFAFETVTYDEVTVIFERWLDTYEEHKDDLNGFIEIDWF